MLFNRFSLFRYSVFFFCIHVKLCFPFDFRIPKFRFIRLFFFLLLYLLYFFFLSLITNKRIDKLFDLDINEKQKYEIDFDIKKRKFEMPILRTNSDENESDTPSSDDILKILITTDNHLGFAERDDERANDSLIAFEECLQIARDENVDFILLGGDLFHDNKPSNRIMLECMNLLRKYCLGDKTIEFKLISDEKINFSSTVQTNPFPWANFKDPNLNIGIPIFSIHGNHDDPSGSTPLCPLDLLNSCGLINYFGNLSSLENIDIHPLLFRKGQTNLSIYGLGSIRDERLHRIFLKNQINLLRPTNEPENWFNIFVIHQNRVAHGPKNYIPEQFLHEFLDIVIWGHEHDCRITPEFNTVQKFFVIQPG